MAMKTTTTLNISPTLHKIVKVGAAQNGWKIGDYADAVIEVGLKHLHEVKETMENKLSVSCDASDE
jgi:hypothetical protein